MTPFRADIVYRVNEQIVAETFDEETVLIDVDRGVYFSMHGSAYTVWRSFEEPRTPHAACNELAAELPPAERDSVEKIIADLAARNLIIAAEETATSPRPLPSLALASFAAPVLGVYTDLADLIGIDPVHEVDADAGWPVRPASPGEVA